MKVLYYIPYLNAVGADYWVYEGWKSAFEDMGHEFIDLTADDDFQQRVEMAAPDILFLPNLVDNSKHSSFFQRVRSRGTRVFMIVSLPLSKEDSEVIKHRDIADIYFGESEQPGLTREFTEQTGREYHLIPYAASKLDHFPTNPVRKYEYDIVYLGANLPKKKVLFESILFPLKRKYRVGIFGPYWTLKDQLLRSAQKVCREVRLIRS